MRLPPVCLVGDLTTCFAFDRIVETPLGFQSERDAENHFLNLSRLSVHLPVWPPVKEGYVARRKFLTTQILDLIAREVTNTPRPETGVYSWGPLKEDKVYKREGSSGRKHVEFGFLASSVWSVAQDMQQNGRRYRWLEQDFVPDLVRAGVLRVFVANSIVHHAVHTIAPLRGNWTWSIPTDVLLPHEMEYVILHLRYRVGLTLCTVFQNPPLRTRRCQRQ